VGTLAVVSDQLFEVGLMFVGIVTVIVALALSAVSAYYGVYGLVSIFAGAAIPVAIMGGVLEAAKLVAASWLYRNWSVAPTFLKIYLTFALVVLMVMSSVGIFGFLSKSHIESSANAVVISGEMRALDTQIDVKKREIAGIDANVKNADDLLKALYAQNRAVRGATELQRQEKNRERWMADAKRVADDVQALELKKNALRSTLNEEKMKVGPIRYVAELIYGESTEEILEKSIRYLIVLIVVVFDPLAVILLVAANISFVGRRSDEIEINESDVATIAIAETDDDGRRWRSRKMRAKLVKDEEKTDGKKVKKSGKGRSVP